MQPFSQSITPKNSVTPSLGQPPAQPPLSTRTLTSLDPGRHVLESRYSLPPAAEETTKQSMALPKVEIVSPDPETKKRRQD